MNNEQDLMIALGVGLVCGVVGALLILWAFNGFGMVC